MTRTGVRTGMRSAQLVVAGMLGALSSWSLALAYSLLDFERGYLAVPFGIVFTAWSLSGSALSSATWLWRSWPAPRPRRSSSSGSSLSSPEGSN